MSKRSRDDTMRAVPLELNQVEIEQRRQKRLKRIRDRVVHRTAVPPPSADVSKLASTFVVRSYQNNLFEQAKQRNLIACLPTGSGKTLVSVLLLQHVKQGELAREYEDLRLDPTAAKGESLPAPDDSKGKATSHHKRLDPNETQRRSRTSFFLVNLVPLVHQQAAVIATHTRLRVGKVYGELKDEVLERKLRMDTWRQPEWDAILQHHDVVVATAQCLLDALIHAYIRMDDIDLLVFDEVHHALKSHPYARIMIFYRLAEQSRRPRVFGLTASPVFSSGNFADAAQLLEQTMDASIVTAPQENQADLQSVVNRPIELVAEYDTPIRSFEPTALSLLVQQQCEHLSEDFTKSVWPKIEHSLLNYGPLMMDLIWLGSSQKYHTKVQRWKERVQEHASKHSLLSDNWTSSADAQAYLGQEFSSSHLSSNNDLNRAMLGVLKDQPQLPTSLTLGPDNCSPKILRLVEILQCFGSTPALREAFCGIVFVQRRQTAASLAELIRRTPSLDFLKPEWLIGHDPSHGPAMDWHDQVEVLERFRRKSPTNLLVATSVAEEGIDIQAANVVIRFDLFDRHSSFLQSKGRARSRDSRFIVMAERGNWDHYRIISSATLTEMGRGDWLAKLAEKTATPEEQVPQIEEDELGYERYLEEPSTGARLYPQDSSTIVSHYVGYLCTEELSQVKADFDVQAVGNLEPQMFVCHLRLPANSKVREVITEAWSTKRAAKRMAALEACKQLRALDLLDEHLMPRMPYRLRWDPANVDSSASRYEPLERTLPRLLHFPVKDFDGWKVMQPIGQVARLPSAEAKTAMIRAYATLLPLASLNRPQELVQYRCLFLITSQSLPPTALMGSGWGPLSREFGEIGPSLPIELDAEQYEKTKRFSSVLFGWTTGKRWNIDDDAVQLVLPATPDVDAAVQAFEPTMVDWGSVALAAKRLFRPATEALLATATAHDLMLVDRMDLVTLGSFSVHGVRRDVTAFSSPPPGSQEANRGSVTYFEDYCKMRQRFSKAQISRPQADEPLLVVRKLNRQATVAPRAVKISGESGPAKAKEVPTRLAIPSLHLLHPLALSIARSGQLLPSILFRYDDLLLAQACNVNLFAGSLPNDALLEALTSPSREAGFDYEVLEFYGDTFLKLAAACQVFTAKLHQTEGELHLASKEILVNAKLFEDAMRVDLWRYTHFSNRWMSKKKLRLPGWKEAGTTVPSTTDKEMQVNELGDEVCETIDDDDTTRPVSLTQAEDEEALVPAGVGQACRDEDEVDAEPSGHLFIGGTTPSTPTGEQDLVGEKTLSDMVEAILGVSVLHHPGDLNVPIASARNLGILPSHIRTMTDFYTQFEAHSQDTLAADGDWKTQVDTSALEHLESRFSYRFRHPQLALEAFTHPSLLASVLPSYQRLEFLGDAFLDFCCVSYIHATYGDMDLDQGDLTTLKGNMVSNATLAALGEVLEIPAYITSHSAPLKEAIEEYLTAVRERRLEAEREQASVATDASTPERDSGSFYQYWWTLKAPKAAADVVESLLGAILVDSHFSIDAGVRFFRSFYQPFLERYCTPQSALVPNIKKLANLLTREKGCRSWGLEVQFCRVTEEGEVVSVRTSEAGDGESKGEEAAENEAGEEEGVEAVRCNVWTHGRLVAQATERIRSQVQYDVLSFARKQANEPGRRNLFASRTTTRNDDAEMEVEPAHSDPVLCPQKKDNLDSHQHHHHHTADRDHNHDGQGGGQLPYDTFRAVIRAMRWARPFDASASFPHIAARTPPRLLDVTLCDCSSSS